MHIHSSIFENMIITANLSCFRGPWGQQVRTIMTCRDSQKNHRVVNLKTWLITPSHTVHFQKPAPVEVGSLSPLFPGFIRTIQTVVGKGNFFPFDQVWHLDMASSQAHDLDQCILGKPPMDIHIDSMDLFNNIWVLPKIEVPPNHPF